MRAVSVAVMAVLPAVRAAAAESVQESERAAPPLAELRAAGPATAPPPPCPLEGNGSGRAQRSQEPGALYQIILTGYQTNYFITGFTGDAAVKFQLSLKLDLWPSPSQSSLYFGYTQKSIWDVYGHRDGFIDSNYAPELFYGYFKPASGVVPRSAGLSAFVDQARLGLLHESNGRTDEQGRSWNRVYGFLAGSTHVGRAHYLAAALEAWVPFFVGENNADITEFIGYGRIGASYTFAGFAREFWGVLQAGAKYSHGWTLDSKQALELSMEWRPGYGGRVSWWRFTPNFFIQFYSGYGEYLLAYDERHTSFRIGISIEDRVYWVNGASETPSP